MKTPTNLKNRIISGSVLIAAMIGILYGDSYLFPKAPFLKASIFLMQIACIIEIANLLPIPKQDRLLLLFGLYTITEITWQFHDINNDAKFANIIYRHSFLIVASAFVLFALFRHQDKQDNVRKLANNLLMLFYLGIPSCYLLLIRKLPYESTLALAATIFVPKLGDVGAYFSGNLIGKHKMAPTLSPKKTWEGFVGGMIVSILTAIAFNFIGPEPLFKNGLPQAALFGLIVGLAGVVGDLFESMLKRDAGTKDASQSIPGFGGVLDVIDSILFAAPVAYLFFVLA